MLGYYDYLSLLFGYGEYVSRQQLALPIILIVDVTVRTRLSIGSFECQLNLSSEKLNFCNYNLLWNSTSFHGLAVFATPGVYDEKAKIASSRHNPSIKKL